MNCSACESPHYQGPVFPTTPCVKCDGELCLGHASQSMISTNTCDLCTDMSGIFDDDEDIWYLPEPSMVTVTLPHKKEESCSICLNAFSDVVVQLVCNHIFHKECVTSWVHQSRTCPVCRTVVK